MCYVGFDFSSPERSGNWFASFILWATTSAATFTSSPYRIPLSCSYNTGIEVRGVLALTDLERLVFIFVAFAFALGAT